MTEISFKVKDNPMNFMQRFPSLKYQDKRDKKFASIRDSTIMKSYPKTPKPHRLLDVAEIDY